MKVARERLVVFIILLFFISVSEFIVLGQNQPSGFLPTDRNALGRFVDRLNFKNGAVVHNLDDPSYLLHLIADWISCEQLTVFFGMSNKKELSMMEIRYREKTMQAIIEQSTLISGNKIHFKENDDNDQEMHLLEFVYLHFPPEDYCTVEELLTKWWSRLQLGGILCGFNFADDHVQTQFLRDYNNKTPDDWIFCPGTQETRRAGLVREGVLKFAKNQNHPVYTTTEQDIVHTFVMQKFI